MSLAVSKSNLGLGGAATLIVMAITIFIIPAIDANAEAIHDNTGALDQHEKLEAHPVATNEFKHITKELGEIKALAQKNYNLLCKISDEC
jgi:hypothetical protein